PFAVDVRPRPELLDDPRREAGRRIVQCVANRLRLRALLKKVTALGVEERLTRARALEFCGRDALIRILRASRRTRQAEVQMESRDVTRILERADAAVQAPPVAALQAVFRVAEPCHQLREYPRDPFRAVSALRRL